MLTCPTATLFAQGFAEGRAASLDLVVVGLNHQTAPVEIRELAAVRASSEVYSQFGYWADEVMVLATCNRTEVYLAGLHGQAEAAFASVWSEALLPYLYVYRGKEAVEHLYRVTGGLNSLVLGETQIQGQVKRAWQESRDLGYSGTILNKVAQGALAAGKRIRTETGMSDKVVSVSSAAVELAQAALGDLGGRTALILGAGETAELTLTHLRAAGIGEVIVVNRTEARARQLAQKVGGRVCAQDYLNEVLPEADVVIASSAAPHWVLDGEAVEKVVSGRGRPMFLIDISMPRILHPDIACIQGAYLSNLDDLTEIVSRNLASRQAALPQAEAILRESSAELKRWHLTRVAQQRRALIG